MESWYIIFILSNPCPAIRVSKFWWKGAEQNILYQNILKQPRNNCSFQNISAIASSVSFFQRQVLFESTCLWVVVRPWFCGLSFMWYLVSIQHMSLSNIGKPETSNSPQAADNQYVPPTFPRACNLPPPYYPIKFLRHSWQWKAPEAINTLHPSFMYSRRQDLCKGVFKGRIKNNGYPKEKF